MRLLNVTTKRLMSFYGNDIPRYAILSHMWGRERDEVLFKHIAGSDNDRREGESRKGYAKLLGACKQAIRDKWEYIWIDTCCIDKQSSAELSEAINSMYTWYRGSEVCYAYLEDVRSNSKARRGRGTTFEIVPFEKSRWFKRGWTLQELIAPRRVVFYSGDWTDIGTKASLRDAISFVTDIRVEMITSYDPDKASVAEKMSWAAKRQTTREEDIAYCLMGLLGVNMPLLYGEGKRAFRRLQEEIMKVSDDQSIFAWRTAYRNLSDRLKLLRETRGVLADSPSNFLGVGNVVRCNDESPYLPYSMSNKGLQIGLPIRPINPQEELIGIDSADNQNVFKAILDCAYRDTNPTRWVVIYLKMVGKGRYVRTFPYWLDGIKINPNEADKNGWAVTSLLVPQVKTSPTVSDHFDVKLRILPTDSGYIYEDESLVKGQKSSLHRWGTEVLIFDREGKRFGVVIGGTSWMDVITEDDYKRELGLTNQSDVVKKIKSYVVMFFQPIDPKFEHIDRFYEEGGSRHHIVLQHLNSLGVNVSSDHSVEVSWKSIVSRSGFISTYEFTIDIREIIIQVPVPIDIKGVFLDDLDPRNVQLNSKEEGIDWLAIFNPKIKRVLNVSPVHSLGDKYPQYLRDEDSLCHRGEDSWCESSVVLFSPDGTYLAQTIKTRSSATVQIYNTITGDTIRVLRDESDWYSNPLFTVCFSPNSNFLAIATHDGRLSLWDINKKCLYRNFASHQCPIKALKFSSDSRLIIVVPKHGVVRILDIASETFKDVCDLGNEKLTSAAISPNNQLVAEAHGVVIRIWDLETKQLVGEVQGHDKDVNCIAFTPDGKGLVSGGNDNTLKYWNIGGLSAAAVEWRKEHSNAIGPVDRDLGRSSQCIMDMRHKYPVTGVAVSHDGNWVISKSGPKTMWFWDLRIGTLQFMLKDRFDLVNSLDMSPAGNVFANYTFEKRLQIWKYNKVEAGD